MTYSKNWALYIDNLASLESRKKIRTVILLILLGASLAEFVTIGRDPLWQGFAAISGGLWLGLSLLELWYLSLRAIDKDDSYFPSAWIDEVLLRLGIAPRLAQNLKFEGKSISREMRDMLLQQGVTVADWEHATSFVEECHAGRLERLYIFSKANLDKVPSLGTAWAFGKIPHLERFASEPIAEVVKKTQRNERNIEKIKAVFERKRGATLLLLSENEDTARETALIFAQRVATGEMPHELEHMRVFFLDTTLLSAETQKESLEKNMRDLISDAMNAGNIILVIPKAGELILSARSLGMDMLSFLDEAMRNPNLHLIFLSSLHEYHTTLGTDKVFNELAEKITIEEPTIEDIMREFPRIVLPIEAEHQIFFTVIALRQALSHAKRLHPERLEDAFADFLETVAIEHHAKKEKIIRSIEVSKVGASIQKDTLLHLEEILKVRVIGQDEALHAVADAMRRLEAGLATSKRPLASFLFLGPTGVGKTETAKALAESYFGTEDKLIRFDMTEFSGADALAKLAGSIFTGETGLLSMQAREKMQGILILDEIEKAHQSALDLFLQILDEGFFTDARGERVIMSNFIIIATSNAKGENLEEVSRLGAFRKELLNRFDAVIFFKPLEHEEKEAIIRLGLRLLSKKLYEEKTIELIFDPSIIEYLKREVEHDSFGARALRRLIQDKIESYVAKEILSGKALPGSHMTLSFREGNLYTVYA